MGHDIDAAESDSMRRRMYEEEQEEEVCDAARERDAAEREAENELIEEWTALDAAWAELVERTERHLEEMEERRAWGDFEHSALASQFFAAGVARRRYLAGIVAWFLER